MSFYFLEDESVENGVKRIVTEEIDEAVQEIYFRIKPAGESSQEIDYGTSSPSMVARSETFRG